MTLRTAAIGAVLAALLLTACGQKGPLYLPEDANTAPEPDTAMSEDTAVSDDTAVSPRTAGNAETASSDEPQVD